MIRLETQLNETKVASLEAEREELVVRVARLERQVCRHVTMVVLMIYSQQLEQMDDMQNSVEEAQYAIDAFEADNDRLNAELAMEKQRRETVSVKEPPAIKIILTQPPRRTSMKLFQLASRLSSATTSSSL